MSLLFIDLTNIPDIKLTEFYTKVLDYCHNHGPTEFREITKSDSCEGGFSLPRNQACEAERAIIVDIALLGPYSNTIALDLRDRPRDIRFGGKFKKDNRTFLNMWNKFGWSECEAIELGKCIEKALGVKVYDYDFKLVSSNN